MGFRYLAPILAQYSAESTAEIARVVTEAVTARVTADVTAQVSRDLVGALRAEMVEVARMLRQQGDASDEVAEVLGRTLVRLSAEIDELGEHLEARRPAHSA